MLLGYWMLGNIPGHVEVGARGHCHPIATFLSCRFGVMIPLDSSAVWAMQGRSLCRKAPEMDAKIRREFEACLCF